MSTTNNHSLGSNDQTMNAMRVHEFGGPEAIAMEEVPIPRPCEGEVLVRVHAAGVGPWDGWIRSGNSVLPQPLPLTLGSDVSGEVVAVGSGPSGLLPGDPVYGVTNKRFTDGYAEYAICRAEMIAPKPETLSHVDAASVPVIAATAFQAIFSHGAGKPGQSVLVHGAAGNVGRFAVQFAKDAGMRVVATVRGDEGRELKRLGADVVLIDSLLFDEKVDLAVDLVGGESQTALFGLLKRGGRLVSAVTEPDASAAEAAGVKASFMLVDVDTETLTRVTAMFDGGDLVTQVGTVLPLEEAVTAHQMLEGSVPRAPGKIVLSVSL